MKKKLFDDRWYNEPCPDITKAYKICLYTGHKLFSLTSTEYCIDYYLGEWAKPQIGKLFVFQSIEYVQIFFESLQLSNFKVFECEIKNPSKIKYAAKSGDIGKFWENDLNEIDLYWVPRGTLVVDEVKLLKEVQ